MAPPESRYASSVSVSAGPASASGRITSVSSAATADASPSSARSGSSSRAGDRPRRARSSRRRRSCPRSPRWRCDSAAVERRCGRPDHHRAVGERVEQIGEEPVGRRRAARTRSRPARCRARRRVPRGRGARRSRGRPRWPVSARPAGGVPTSDGRRARWCPSSAPRPGTAARVRCRRAPRRRRCWPPSGCPRRRAPRPRRRRRWPRRRPGHGCSAGCRGQRGQLFLGAGQQRHDFLEELHGDAHHVDGLAQRDPAGAGPAGTTSNACAV